MKTLRLENGAFNQELLRFTSADKVGWYGDDHGHFVDALLARLLDADNGKAQLDNAQLDTVQLVFRPTEVLQRRVLKQTFAAAGYELDSTTETFFVSLFDVVGFGNYLSKKNNPKTGKPYIKKAVKGGRKDALDALMDQEAEPAKAEALAKPAMDESAITVPNQPAQAKSGEAAGK